MCKISDKLKLCTCKTAIDNLKHYWVLYRFVNGKEEMLMGEPVMPVFIDPAMDTFNRSLLLKLLNDGNIFDDPLYPVNKDRLQLYFKISDEGGVHYGFIYKKNDWQAIEFDYFDWFSKHDEIKKGKIKSPFKIVKATGA